MSLTVFDIDMKTEVFASNLRRIRHRMKLSQTAFAELSRFPQSHVSDFETGRRTPTLKNLFRLRKALGVTWEELLGK